MVSFRAPLPPWTISADDQLRFRRTWQRVLILCALFFIAMPWLPVTQPDRTQPQDLAAPMAKLLLEHEAPPLPPPVVKKAEPLAARPDPTNPAARKPEPRKIEEKKGAVVPEARVPQPNKPPGEVDAARRKAAGIGLLAMSNDLAEMHGAPLAVQLKADIKPGLGVGTGVGVGVGAGNETGIPTRALITSNATGGSGGINTAGYSRNTGGGGLAGRSTTLVEGVAGGGGGGGAGGGGARGRDGSGTGAGGGSGLAAAGANDKIQRSGSGKASRSIEDVKLVFERNKGSIYAIYNRMLREDPTLQGKIVIKLTIAPSGSAECQIVSSELKTPELESKLLARVRQFDFGAKDVEVLVINWPVDFLPS